MQGNRSRDTSPEVAVRRAVHALGLRYRVDRRPVRSINRRADLVFSRIKVAVFIDGCYWHGCPEHFVRPKSNVDYWSTKIGRNVERDRETNARLRDEGWTVLRFWEHDDPAEAAERIEAAVRQRATSPGDGTASA